MKRIFTFALALLMIINALPIASLQAYAAEVEEIITPSEEVQLTQTPQPETCEHSYASVVTPPTCTEQGYTTYTCATCGNSYADTYVDAPGHNCVKSATVPATQTKDGYILYECTNCDYSYKDIRYAPGLPSVTPHSDDYVLIWGQLLEADSYEVWRATSKNGTFVKVADVPHPFWRDPNVTMGKTYYYKVRSICAEKPELSSDFGKVYALTYKCSMPQLEGQIDSVSGGIELYWAAINGAKKYDIYRSTTATSGYKKIGSTSKLSYTDASGTVGKVYYYKIRAVASNSKYNSEYSEILYGNSICGQPQVTVALDSATGQPKLTWKKVNGAESYLIARYIPESDSTEILAEQTGCSFVDTTAPSEKVCFYAVQALGKTEDLDGMVSEIVSATSGIAKPVITGKTNSDGQPTLTWDAVEGAVKYEIYRSTKSNKSYTKIATVDSLSYADDSFAAGTAYYYKVVAIGAVSKSAESSYVKLTGKCGTPVISAGNGTSGKPYLSWEKVTGAKQYTVYRATTQNGKYSKIGTSKTTAYEDKKASVGKTYFYKVIANGSKSSGNSDYSNIVSCSVRLAAPKIKLYEPSDVYGDPLISWESLPGAKGYRILRKRPGETEFTVIKEWTENYFRDSTAALFEEYVYVVQTIGSKPEYDSVYTEEMTILSTMGQPLVTALSKDYGASLSWYPVEGAVSYDIFVSDTKDGKFTLLLNKASTGYVHKEVQPNRDYYYKVVAIGESGLRVEGSVDKLCIRCKTPRASVEVDTVSGKPVISWEAVNGATKGYEIYRSTDGEHYKKLKVVKTLSYTDTSATPGQDYTYQIRALGASKDYNSKWDETGYVVTTCAQPKVTVKLNKSGDPVVSWKKVSGAKQYIVMYVDVTAYIDSETGPSESYLEENMQYITTTKTSVTLSTPSDRLYLITMIAVPKNAGAFSAPSDVWYVVTE